VTGRGRVEVGVGVAPERGKVFRDVVNVEPLDRDVSDRVVEALGVVDLGVASSANDTVARSRESCIMQMHQEIL
jgi:hypothetical protein